MATNTPHLNLLKKDVVTDGHETFNIETMLNENWDKIDTAFSEIENNIDSIDVPSASTTQPGIVQLTNDLGTSETLAVTQKALNDVATSLEKTAATKEEVQTLNETVTMYKNETAASITETGEKLDTSITKITENGGKLDLAASKQTEILTGVNTIKSNVATILETPTTTPDMFFKYQYSSSSSSISNYVHLNITGKGKLIHTIFSSTYVQSDTYPMTLNIIIDGVTTTLMLTKVNTANGAGQIVLTSADYLSMKDTALASLDSIPFNYLTRDTIKSFVPGTTHGLGSTVQKGLYTFTRDGISFNKSLKITVTNGTSTSHTVSTIYTLD